MNFEEKGGLRKEIRKILTEFHKNLNERQKHSLAENLCEKVTSLQAYKNAGLVFAYIPDKLEANCIPIILDALENHKKVCVPKVDFEALKAGKSEMDFYFLESSVPLEDQLETGAYGIREPKAGLKPFRGVARCEAGCSGGKTSPVQRIFMLVPGVAFTKDGKRLGHGKGFYDIYIERLKKAGINPFLCGISLPCQIVDDIPTDAHDILMDKVIF